MMSDPGLQRGLYRFVEGQTMTANFSESKPVVTFDKDHDDWGMLGG